MTGSAIDYSQLKKDFISRFQVEPRIFRSPGRINLIGEHTDYNQGFVMPAGIDREIAVLMAPSMTDESYIYSADTDSSVSFSQTDYHNTEPGWARYIIGVYDQLLLAGHHPGPVLCLFSGNIPAGAGLSSSAALECAALYGYCSIFDIPLDQRDIALMAQKAENEFVGVMCGIMDQYASVFAKPDQVFRLDCRDLVHSFFPLELSDYELLLVDSTVKHTLATSEYNVRREQCEQGVAILQDQGISCVSLRDVNRSQLDAHRNILGELLYRRCKFVIDENARVLQSGECLLRSDLETLGSLIYASHDGLSKEYEVSCRELDFLVDFTRDQVEVLGARMMGGGFGGCTINLVRKDYSADFMKAIGRAFRERYGRQAPMYEVNIAGGTSEIKGI